MKSFRKEHKETIEKQDPDRGRRLAMFLPLAIAVAILLQFVMAFFSDSTVSDPHPMLGKPVPAFVLASLDDENAQVTNQAMQGTPYLINTFASWCAICQIEHGALVDFAKNNRTPIIGLAHNDSRENIQNMLGKKGNPYLFVAMDSRGDAASLFGLKQLPTTMAVNSKGIITFVREGRVTETSLGAMVQSIEQADAP